MALEEEKWRMMVKWCFDRPPLRSVAAIEMVFRDFRGFRAMLGRYKIQEYHDLINQLDLFKNNPYIKTYLNCKIFSKSQILV